MSANLETVLVVIASVALLIIVIVTIIYIIKKIYIKYFLVKKDCLSYLQQYTYYGSYSSSEKIRNKSMKKIIFKFKDSITNNESVSIESKFNKKFYAVFDLDTKEHLELFKTLYDDIPYALFISSSEDSDSSHYWAIVDNPCDKIEDIFFDHNWKICNDQKYVSFCRSYETLMIRGLYENEHRKPKLYNINKNISKDFQLFIDKLLIYYKKEGFELSVLRYQDPTMLIKFNRKKKLDIINKNGDNT